MSVTESHPRTGQAEKKYFIVSADCHAHEPLDLWERRGADGTLKIAALELLR